MKKGEVMGPEQRTKISASLKGHPVSAASRAKIGIANVGRPMRETTRVALLAANIGRKMSAENRVRLIASNMGRMVSPETRTKLRLARIGKWIGDKNPRWNGGRTVSSPGYAAVVVNPGCYLPIHRMVMAKEIGRKFKRGEVIHHINRNKQDNRPTNLALCSSQAAHKWCDSEEAKIFFGG